LTEAVEKATHQERGDLIDRLGRLLRRFHESGLKHRDLKAANLLVNDSGIHFIDLVGVSRHSKVPFLRRVRDLARLNGSFHQSTQLSQTDKLRFLRAYLQWSLQGSEGWKAWWTALAAATREKIARNQRTGRPLA